MKYNIKHKTYKKGFTLIETMVAIVVLSMALIPVLGLISNSLFVSRYSVNEITANYLLQEVADYVKNDIDSYILRGENWDISKIDFESKYSSCLNNKECNIDVKNGTIYSCGNNCIPLNYDENARSGNFYNYDTSNPVSNFTRNVTISENQEGATVKINVSFKNGNTTRVRTLIFPIINWQ